MIQPPDGVDPVAWALGVRAYWLARDEFGDFQFNPFQPSFKEAHLRRSWFQGWRAALYSKAAV